MSFQNRTVIAGGNGLINLSTPLLGGRDLKEPIGEKKIAYQKKWQYEHWRGIESCYGKSAYWEFYKQTLQELFLIQPIYLYEWNEACLLWVYSCLKQAPNFRFVWEKQSAWTDGLFENSPKHYKMIETNTRYQQVFMERYGFQNNLSIIDLIFCCGPQAIAKLGITK